MGLGGLRIDTLEPFEIHPLLVAEQLHARTPRWRWVRRRRLGHEVQRIMSTMSLPELQALLNARRAVLVRFRDDLM